VSELNTELLLHDNLLSVFTDPDGDDLTFSVECNEAGLTFTMAGNELKASASSSFEGEALVTVTATDGEYEASTSFKMTAEITGISRGERNEEITYYPNPVKQVLHIKLNLKSGYTGPVSFHLINMAGMEVLGQVSDHVAGGTGSISLDLSNETGAYYILKVNAGGEYHALPVLKL